MRSRIVPLSLVALLAAVAAAGCGGSSAVPSSAVARVGGQAISLDDFNRELDLEKRIATASKQKFPKTGSSAYEQRKQQIVQLLVQQKAYEIKADQAGVKVTDKQVTDYINNIKKQQYKNSDAALTAAMKKAGITLADLQGATRINLLVSGIKQKVDASVSVSQGEIKKYYDQHKSSFNQPESRDLAHILVKTKTLADTIYAQLQSGGNFGKLARKYSTDQSSAKAGGKLVGCCSKGQTVAPFEKVAFALKTNEISKPVHTRFGWHIIKALSALKPAHVTPFSEEQAAIHSQLLQQRQSAAETKWQTDFKSWVAKQTKYQQGYAPTTTSQAGQLTTTTAP
ncbi:MAG: peptidylprolyl isomerase [Gaiellaceae bacterium]